MLIPLDFFVEKYNIQIFYILVFMNAKNFTINYITYIIYINCPKYTYFAIFL